MPCPRKGCRVPRLLRPTCDGVQAPRRAFEDPRRIMQKRAESEQRGGRVMLWNVRAHRVLLMNYAGGFGAGFERAAWLIAACWSSRCIFASSALRSATTKTGGSSYTGISSVPVDIEAPALGADRDTAG